VGAARRGSCMGTCTPGTCSSTRPGSRLGGIIDFTDVDAGDPRSGMPLERFATLDRLADAIWNVDAPGLSRGMP
jgi:hypothetical protein